MTNDEHAIAAEVNLASAMLQLLDDMGKDGLCVCKFAKAQARIAYEPYIDDDDDDRSWLMSLEDAQRIIEECRE